jgi:hypothetical protein
MLGVKLKQFLNFEGVLVVYPLRHPWDFEDMTLAHDSFRSCRLRAPNVEH